MADTYVKLWASIVDSSIWSQPMATRLVWITMLVMADENGFVGASVDGIARRANVTVEEAEAAVRCLESPDDRSRSDTEDGRRIRPVTRGWHIINHGYFRDLRDKEARREYERQRKAEYRSRKKSPGVQDKSRTGRDKSQMSAHADASASPDAQAEMDGWMDGGSRTGNQKGEGGSTPVPPDPQPTKEAEARDPAKVKAINDMLAKAKAGIRGAGL